MGYSIAGNHPQRTNEPLSTTSTTQPRIRRRCHHAISLPMPGTYLSRFYTILVVFFVLYTGMTGNCFVAGSPLRGTLGRDGELGRAIRTVSESGSLHHLKSPTSFVDLVRRVNEHNTSPSSSKDAAPDSPEVAIGLPSAFRLTNSEDRPIRERMGRTSEEERRIGEFEEEILQYLSDPLGKVPGHSSQKRAKRDACRIKLQSKTGKYLRVMTEQRVTFTHSSGTATCLEDESVAPGWVRLFDPATDSYISMSDAGVIQTKASSLTSEYDRSTMWRAVVSTDMRYDQYYQPKSGDMRWYLSDNAINVQGQATSSDHVKFRKVICPVSGS